MAIRNRLLGGIAAATLLFALLSRWVLTGQSVAFDLQLRGAVHAWASPLLTSVMLVITNLGSEYSVVPLGVILIWHLVSTGRRRHAVLLAAGTIGAEALSLLLKLAFQRPRPPIFFGLSSAETYSFPSGHAFVAAVFYGLIALVFLAGAAAGGKRTATVVMAFLIAALIGLSRVYLGYHYPSDVLAGWVAAAGWLALARLASIRWVPVSSPERSSTPPDSVLGHN